MFNEAETASTLLDGLVAVEIPGVDVEIVVVESNSSDGTREIALRYENHPRVRVILQDQPRGKGNAVREGFAHITGDIVGIQDGDLEYDLGDYPRLLAPLLDGTADVVLGSRHVPGQPIRQLGDRWLQSKVVNAAHWAFTLLFDAVYGVRLRDPFTMYKVFRRECIEGLPLVSDRFDFDWELLGKLVRRGYKPVEVRVRYTSRSFEGGKKVRFFRDPPTWIRACARFRMVSIPPPVPRRVLPGSHRAAVASFAGAEPAVRYVG